MKMRRDKRKSEKATSAASCHGQTCLANKWLWRHWAWYEDLSGASGSRHHKKLIPASLQRRCYIASIKTDSRRWGVWSKGDGRSYRHGHHLHDDQHKNAVIMKLKSLATHFNMNPLSSREYCSNSVNLQSSFHPLVSGIKSVLILFTRQSLKSKIVECFQKMK